MQQRQFGNLWPVSALTLGGGGIAQAWGETTREEAIATTRLAVERGITLLDVAPMYGRGEAERIVGETFGGHLPKGVRISTKCFVGMIEPDEARTRLETSLARSIKTMGVEQVDLFFLHSNICPDGYVYARSPELKHRMAVDWSLYTDTIVPTMERLVEKGMAGAWGITGVGQPDSIQQALTYERAPSAVQAIANLMDSPGDMRRYAEPPVPRDIIALAGKRDIGVMGIRIVQAGALTASFDRDIPSESLDWADYERAASFRALSEEVGEDPARLATRYALSMDGVDTVVLGVKNRQELEDALAVEAQGPLDASLIARIDALGLNTPVAV
ncbi:MAG: aldo/keto reductase [Parvularculales bacterium]